VKSDYYDAAVAIKPDLVAFMQEIIRIPSLSSEEGAVIDRISEEMLRIGYDEVTVDPMGNLIGRIGSGERIIAFDGHVDVVDVGDPDLWDRDPYSGDVEGDILYGRGASDMKGGVASSVYAGAILKRRGIPENVSFYVTATVQEEDCDGLCWQYIVNEDGLRPDLVVVTEPTSLRLYYGHRGRMEMEVHTSGIDAGRMDLHLHRTSKSSTRTSNPAIRWARVRSRSARSARRRRACARSRTVARFTWIAA
jgi:putative selenium metabolism hydrolase